MNGRVGRFQRVALVVCLVVALVMALVVAGSSGSKASAASAKCQKPAGEPIKISTIASLTGTAAAPWFAQGAQASAKSINCDGGVKGRPLEIVVCDGNAFTDPNLPGNCARKAIAEQVVASAGRSVSDASVAKSFADAGIPSVQLPLLLADLTTPLQFNISAGGPGNFAGAAAYLYDHGARKIKVIVIDYPGASAIATLANTGLKSRGAETAGVVLYPADPSADTSALIQSAISDADGLIVLLTDTQMEKAIPEIRSAGYKGLLATTNGAVTPTFVKSLGKLAEGMTYISGFWPTAKVSEPGIKKFNQDMDRFAPKIFRTGALSPWASVQIVADALKSAPTLDAAGVAQALATYKVTLDIGPDIDFAQGGAYGVPRLFTPYVLAERLKKGVLLADGDFFDPTATPTAKSASTK